MKAKLVHVEERAAYFIVDKLWEWHEKAVEKRLFDRGLPIKSVDKVVFEGRGAIKVSFAMGRPASAALKLLNESTQFEKPDARTVYVSTASFFLRDYFSSTKWHGPMVLESGDEFFVVGNFTGDNIVIQVRTGKNKGKRGILSAQEWDALDTRVEARGHIGDYETPFAKTDRSKSKSSNEDAVSAMQRTGHDTNLGTQYKQVIRNYPEFPSRKPIGDHYRTPSPQFRKKKKPPSGDQKSSPGGRPGNRGGASKSRSRPKPRPRPRPRQRRR